jgi:hypothetical protein
VTTNKFSICDFSVFWNIGQLNKEACVGALDVSDSLTETPKFKPVLYFGPSVGCCIMSLYCIYFPETGWRTAFIIGVFVQWLLPKGMALLALPMSQKSPWDKFLGERLRALAGTLGGAALLADGVTTLGSCGKFRDSLTWAGT